MSTQEEPPSNPDAPRAKRDPTEAPNQAGPDEIEQVIARISAKYIANLRALSEELIQQPLPAENEHSSLPAQTGAFERQREATPAAAENVSPGFASPEAPASQPMPATVSPIDQFRDYIAGPAVQRQARQELANLGSETYSAPSAYRTVIAFMLCGLAVLVVIGVVLFRSARAGDDERGTYVAPAAAASVLPLPSAAASTSRSAAIVSKTASTLPSSTPIAREPSPAPTKLVPTTRPPSAVAVLQQVAAAEAALRTGQFEAAIDYGNGNRSSARVRFDLADATHVPRIHVTSTYEGTSGAQTVERITIGEQSWQRDPDGHWIAKPAREAVSDQVYGFLPHADSAADPAMSSDPNTAVLHWYDVGRAAEVTLSVDPASGIPRELRQLARATSLILTVTYSGWNTPVEITPPPGM